ncbi:universal stress protein UspA-like protein [Xenococcus sp. PCC 7305]|uniref:universal stress protein n=1 Tax=Xenococcus sp. PCC 7305 TaxID=102125 RepID=UPI0002AC354F|nr:universal stress protein [Xenococcus sp. PCC 7305]ELS03014.1 universal stress protein UspA-like protein [Xenococcus sp. PCC 7305]
MADDCWIVTIFHQKRLQKAFKQDSLIYDEGDRNCCLGKKMYQRILVAVDDSSISRQAFNQAVSLAKAFSAQLHLIHVILPVAQEYQDASLIAFSGGFYPGGMDKVIKETWSTIEKAGLSLLQDLGEKSKASGVIAEFTQKIGQPEREITEFAKTWDADLIVIGSHGRKGLNELVLGSVSNYVLHHVSCSVLLIHPQVTSEISSESVEVAE